MLITFFLTEEYNTEISILDDPQKSPLKTEGRSHISTLLLAVSLNVGS